MTTNFETWRDGQGTAATPLPDAAPASCTITDDTAVLTGHLDQMQADDIIREHGLDPDEWEIVNCTVNRWESQKKGGMLLLHRQLKIHLRKRNSYPLLLPAPQAQEWRPPPPRPLYLDGPRLILVTGDPQIPFHDERLHDLTCQFAHDNRVDEWIDLGDFLDLPMLTKHRQKPEWMATLQESIDAGSRILHDRTSASPDYCRKRRIGGNHDVRLRNWLLDHAPVLYGLRRSDIGPDAHSSVLDLDYLLRSRELGWESVTSPYGEYPYTEVEIAPGLVGIHGNTVRPGAGNSVRQELAKRDHSVIQGHVNKLAMITQVRYQSDGSPWTVYGVESGMLGRTDGGMGFSHHGDWMQGFVTVTVWPDEHFSIELVPYLNDALTWRGRRWSADAAA
jgi:hypothetical protein